MLNNTTPPQGTETQPHGYSIPKTRKRAVKFLQFFAEWAEDVQAWETPEMLKCLDQMQEAFLHSDLADHKETRISGLFYLNLMHRLIKKLNKQPEAVVQYMNDEIAGLNINADAQ